MSMTVVGLFREVDSAKRAYRELMEKNFHDTEGFSKQMNNANRVEAELRGTNVPNNYANLYQRGVESGYTLLLSHSSDADSRIVEEVMERYGALHLDETSNATVNADYIAGENSSATATASHVQEPVSNAVIAATTPSAGVEVDNATRNANVTPEALYNAQTASTQTTVQNGDTIAVPIIEENLAVGKREVERGGVRVYTRTTERPVQESVTLREETVSVERRPVNRVVSPDELDRLTDQHFELRETAEVAVVAKEARVVEEVVVGKETTQRTETIKDTVRRTDVEVEEINADQTRRASETVTERTV